MIIIETYFTTKSYEKHLLYNFLARNYMENLVKSFYDFLM